MAAWASKTASSAYVMQALLLVLLLLLFAQSQCSNSAAVGSMLR
jgi:hypothetical protein